MAQDPKLTAALKQAKTSPMFFVFIAKGNEGKLLVDKNKINPKDADDAKKKCGGGTLHTGRCRCEEGLMVFEVAKEVATTVAAATKKVIKQDTGLTLDVVYRVAADVGEDAAESPSPSGAEVMKRLNAMAAGIKSAVLGPNNARVQALFVSVNALLKRQDFAQASKTLDELEPLLANPASTVTAPAEAAAPADAAETEAPAEAAPAEAAPAEMESPAEAVAPPPTDGAALVAEFERRVTELEPRVAQARKTRAGEAKWMMMFMTAQDLGSEEEYAKALAVLDKLAGLLDAAPKGKSPESTAALASWAAARADAVQRLEGEIAEVVAASKTDAGDSSPGGPVGAEGERFDILGAQAELELRAVVKRLASPIDTRQQAEEMQKYLGDDEVVADVCEMAFDFRTPLLGALAALVQRIAA
jgi:hypothetical protein